LDQEEVDLEEELRIILQETAQAALEEERRIILGPMDGEG